MPQTAPFVRWTLPPNEDHICPQGATQEEAKLREFSVRWVFVQRLVMRANSLPKYGTIVFGEVGGAGLV